VTVRYIGSKARIAQDLASHIGKPTVRNGEFVDAFCGTGVVAEVAARNGWDVHLNDHLRCATIMAAARLTSASAARFRKLGGYEAALDKLNRARPRAGFMWRAYSPASADHGASVERMYFTEANAKRIDGARAIIAEWAADGTLCESEERLLLADLMAAANRVANIAGTYGCFLSHWLDQALNSLALRPRPLFDRAIGLRVSNVDVRHVAVDANDLVYLDPPYTKRQYAAYYHILETIAAGDAPTVGGITGLRPWQEKASDFCYRTRAMRAITDLVDALPARRVLLSYSDEGHVPLQPLLTSLREIGAVKQVELGSIGRYRPNRAASAARGCVTEHLMIISRTARMRRAA
jgi:adenine-specific DNA-methyltransferase